MKPPDEENPENSPIERRKWTTALLSAHFGIPARTLSDIASKAGLKGSMSDGWDFEAVAKAFVDHYKSASETEASEAAKDRARQQKAEADLSELKLGREAETLIHVDEIKRLLTSAIVRYREKIRQLPGLTLDQKKDVMEQLATLTLEEVEE